MTRLNDLSSIEARLLELAHTTDAKITAPALAYFAPCSIEDAQRVLDDLTTRGQLQMDVQDDGSITYEMLGRQKLAPSVKPALPVLRREVDEWGPPTLARDRAYDRRGNPLVAAFLSLWIPGAGHLYAGRWVAAVLWFLVVGAGYTLILPGLVLHMFAIASAAVSAAQPRTPFLLAGRPYRGLLPAPALQR